MTSKREPPGDAAEGDATGLTGRGGEVRPALAVASYTVRDAIPADCFELAGRLAKADARELEGLGQEPTEALVQSYERSMRPRTVVGPSGLICGMHGVCRPNQEGWSVAWILGADELRASPRWFLAMTVSELLTLAEGVGGLYNAVDGRYEAALRWLKWLGFTDVGEYVVPATGVPFRVMQARCEDLEARWAA